MVDRRFASISKSQLEKPVMSSIGFASTEYRFMSPVDVSRMSDDAAGIRRKNAITAAVAYARRDASDASDKPITAMKHEITSIPPRIGASFRYSSLNASHG